MDASIARVLRAARPGVSEDVEHVPHTIDELFSAHAESVWRVLRHFGVAGADLDDQTQEVFIIAHRRLSEWDGKEPRAWLCAIARRTAANYRRQSHRLHECSVATMPDSSDTRDLAAGMELDELYRLLDALGEDKRTVFVLYEVEELSMREVAEIVQCSLPTAYARLHAARRELARALEEAK